MKDYTQTAMQYLQNQFSIIPLQLDGSKEPVGSWQPYTERYASGYELQTWFADGSCGFGIVCGSISQNLLVIDFDHNAEQLFEQFWTDAQQLLPSVTDNLVVSATPRPGRQVWMRSASQTAGSTVLAYTAPTGEPPQPKVAIETRGSGAYVCAPGGPAAVHSTGRPYQFIHGKLDHLPQLPDSTVAQLLNICRGYSQWAPQHVQRKPGQPYTGEPRPGDIYNQHADPKQLLLNAGWEMHSCDASGQVDYLRRPGKDTPGHSASLGHICSDDGKPLLFVFSSNAAPFEAGQAYDAFAVYSLLQHGGDFGRAAAAVRIQYAEQVTAAQQQFHAQVAEQIPDRLPWNPFPTDCLPAEIQDYCCEHAQAIGIDHAFVALPLLATLAGLIGSSRILYLKRSYSLPSVLWTCTVADVSSGKTPGWMAGTAPAESIEHSLQQTNATAAQTYQRQLDEWTQAGDRKAPKPDKPDTNQQFVISDTTLESLVDVHQKNSKLLLSCDELAGWVKGMNQYRPGRDTEAWLAIYNAGSLSVNRKQDGYRVWMPRTSISVTGTIQPQVAQDVLFTQAHLDNGLAARILTCQPPGGIVRWTDDEPAEAVDQQMTWLAQRLYLLTGEQHGTTTRPLPLPCTADARQAFIQWTNDAADHAEQLPPELRSSWLKLRPTAGRFALVLSVCKQLLQHPDGQAQQPVDAESMAAGIELARWFGQELERSAAGDQQAELQQHLQWILRYHPQGLDVRTLQQGRRSIQSADAARIVFQKLLELGTGSLSPAGLFIPSQKTA